MKQDFIDALDSIGCKNYKLRYIKKGKYGEEEAWVYPKHNPKQEKVVYRKSGAVRIVDHNGNPIMESTSGLLIEKETLQDKKYFMEYIQNCMPQIYEKN